MRTLLLAVVAMLGVSHAAAQPYTEIWRAEGRATAGTGTPALFRSGDDFLLHTRGAGIRDLFGRPIAPLAEGVSHVVMIDERRFFGLVDQQSHYFSGGVDGRLVAGELGSPNLTRLTWLGEVQPYAATAGGGRNWIMYSRDDEPMSRIASFNNEGRRTGMTARFEAETGHASAQALAWRGDTLRLFNVAAVSRCGLRLRVVDVDPAMRATQRASTCISGITQANIAIHEAGPDIWYVVASRWRSAEAWRVRFDEGELSVTNVWGPFVWTDARGRILSGADADTGALFLVHEGAALGPIDIVRVSADGTVRSDQVDLACPDGGDRYTTRISTGREVFLFATPRGRGSCARIWRLE
jgi:hypothetical protein